MNTTITEGLPQIMTKKMQMGNKHANAVAKAVLKNLTEPTSPKP
jgi:hypothetical protein